MAWKRVKTNDKCYNERKLIRNTPNTLRGLAKNFEVVFESIPQLIIQSYMVFIKQDSECKSTYSLLCNAQYISIAISMFTITYSLTDICGSDAFLRQLLKKKKIKSIFIEIIYKISILLWYALTILPRLFLFSLVASLHWSYLFVFILLNTISNLALNFYEKKLAGRKTIQQVINDAILSSSVSKTKKEFLLNIKDYLSLLGFNRITIHTISNLLINLVYLNIGIYKNVVVIVFVRNHHPRELLQSLIKCRVWFYILFYLRLYVQNIMFVLIFYFLPNNILQSYKLYVVMATVIAFPVAILIQLICFLLDKFKMFDKASVSC